MVNYEANEPVDSGVEARIAAMTEGAGFGDGEAWRRVTGASAAGFAAQDSKTPSVETTDRVYTPADEVSGRDMGLQATDERAPEPISLSVNTVKEVKERSLALRRSWVAGQLLEGKNPTEVRARDKAREARRQRSLPSGSLFRD